MLPDNSDRQDTGMLSVFDTVTIDNNERIAAADTEFCTNQQKMLYEALDNLDKWHRLFMEDANRYKDKCIFEIQENGGIECKTYVDSNPRIVKDYLFGYFLPFESINKVILRRENVIQVFIRSIISYFNDTYDLRLSVYEYETEYPFPARPDYNDILDYIILRTGGRSFRQTAIDEMLRKLHLCVNTYSEQRLPEIKGNSILFYELIYWDKSWLPSQFKIEFKYQEDFYMLLTGLSFYGNGNLTGGEKTIMAFNHHEVDITDLYPLNTKKEISVRFHKNAKVEVIFPDRQSAKECFKLLQFDKLGED